jgi:hypothetical protein
MLRKLPASILLVLSACGETDRGAPTASFVDSPDVPTHRDSTAAPSAAPGLRGIVTDDDQRPVPNAGIVLGTFPTSTPATFTDSSGAFDLPNYHLSTCLDPSAYASAVKDGYEIDSRCIMKSSQNFHLYRIKRLAAGDSTSLTVAQGDTAPCWDDNYGAPLSEQWACRTVRIVMPTDGVLTVDVRSADPLAEGTSGLWLWWTAPGSDGGWSCCDTRASLQPPAGVEAVAMIMLRANLATETFVVRTSVSSAK